MWICFLIKKILIGSKRGRSHAHEGLFREDHFLTKKLEDNWEIIAVSDGAGSAKFARQGSKLATEFICKNFYKENQLIDLSALIVKYFEIIDDETQHDEIVKLKTSIINVLYKAVLNTHKELNEFAETEEITSKDLNATLIFTLIKKFEFGYVILSFGVGDCPINVIINDFEEVKLLNTLDVGEFGGGTRFITMPEIFNNDIGNRFNIYKTDNFSHLFLMTDGIYDPKFVVESKLEKIENWKNFDQDLKGNNEENTKIDFSDDENIENQLMDWMDFWSKGNHDDRTLAIVY